ncbi:hypothetical protein GIB67_035821 [Kingdonia uniflora]|uniref:HD domain-containing protein n=1 Tax=Kingdonia uniflora TaxID=39325 RepID=A0A7J7MJV6_9MAGN|nr:hypothetical protein GIB67_035821 [Kingdonia uniflora]
MSATNQSFCKNYWCYTFPSIVPISFSHQNLTFKSLPNPLISIYINSPLMATNASSLPSSNGGIVVAPSSASSAIDFLTLCHRLKTTKRAGWIRRDIQDPESIADHMYRMSIMALIAADIPGVDRDKCVKMAIVHDIAEAIVGDITPVDGVSKLEKSRREREALDYLCKLLGGGSRAKEIDELWMEYEGNSSLEAKVVKDFDKVCLASSFFV